MAYMPDDVKERLKKEVSIQRLAEARGIKLRRVGKELIGLCPFHDDRNPSLNIDPVKNVWSCKGACGEGGDVIRGSADGRRERWPCHRAAEEGLRAVAGAGGEDQHGAEAALPGDAGRGGPGGDAGGGAVLSPDAQ